jgi:4-amino-4-deoxy-L-arabinose transferase-like glycosyltransferase
VKFSVSSQRFCFFVLLFVMAVRLLSLGLIPLGDKTEARYGEIARLMLQTGDWITPQIEAGVPFWGKPPLSTWLSALSFKFLGINEFAARLPSFVLGIVVLWLTYRLASQKNYREHALRAILILATMPLFFVSSGAVMTDPALLLGTTLSMTAFGIVISNKPCRKIWSHLFFVGLAIGLLAKGPVALVMTGLPIALWTLWQRKWSQIWQQFPWIIGLLLMVILSFPWYLFAELKTPGFLNYFFIGEHWNRFMVSGWKGDLYGSGHAKPHGTIWFYWLLAAFPWSFAILYFVRNKISRSRFKAFWRETKEWNAYLLLWSLAPMLFFSLARNILWTYTLTGLPAFSILMSGLFQHQKEDRPAPDDQQDYVPREFLLPALGMSALFALALIPISMEQVSNKISQKNLIAKYHALRSNDSEQLTYFFQKPYSADFYSNGEARLIKNLVGITAIQSDPGQDFFAVRNIEGLPAPFLAQVVNLGKFGRYYLVREKNP